MSGISQLGEPYTVIGYICLIAILNLGFGFALAVHLGRSSSPFAPSSEESTAASSETTTLSSPEDTEATMATLQAEFSSRDDHNDSKAEHPTVPKEAVTATPPTAQTYLKKLQAQAHVFQEKLLQSDDRLQDLIEEPNVAEIEACLSSMMQATNEYLEHRNIVQSELATIEEEHQEMKPICKQVQAAVDRQSTSLEATEKSIGSFDYSGNLQAECQKTAGETSLLIDANHHLCETLQVAEVEAQRNGENAQALSPTPPHDPTSGISSLADIEAFLLDWWEHDPDRRRQLSLGLLDIDQLARINERYELTTGNQIVQAVEKMLESERHGDMKFVRLAGGRFILLLPDQDLRFTTNLVEKIRQIVEHSHFQYGDQDLQITLTCGVTAALAEDDSQILIARADHALAEAKRYGRNRTFLDEGKYPAPVVPPNFTLEERHIPL